jgi:membrane protein required for colicin V production
MNTLDLIVVIVIAASALLAFFRGFVREVLAIGAWIGAIAVAYYFNLPTRGFFRSLISASWVADIVGPIVLFIAALIVFSLITGFLTSHIRNSQLSAVDRALGLGFGAARGALVVCLAYIGLNYFIPPENRPPWIAQAKTLPLLDAGAQELGALVPQDMVKKSGKTAQDMLEKAQQAQKAGEDLRALSAPPEEAKPGTPAPAGTATPAPQRQQSTAQPAAPTSYSNKMSDQMDQAVQQAIQGKQ